MRIGVFGSAAGNISGSVIGKARAIGRRIAERGHVIITGACTGLPYEAVLGAHELGGEIIGYSPAADIAAHVKVHKFPAEPFAELIFVPANYAHINDPLVCRKYRNVSSVADSDAAIFIGGRIGTMNEFTIAYDLGKVLGILEGSGGIADGAIRALLRDAAKESGAIIIYESDPVSLVDRVIEAFEERSGMK